MDDNVQLLSTNMYKRVNIADHMEKVALASIQLVQHLFDV